MKLKAKTTMKINFLVKMIMIVLFVLGAFVFFVDISKAAVWAPVWVNTADGCPQEDPETLVSCGSDYICGKDTQLWCATAFDITSSLRASPLNSTNIIAKPNSNSLPGGKIYNCYANKDTTNPFCDNNGVFVCNPDAGCLANKVQTICAAGLWAGETGSFSCDTASNASTTGCVSGWANCDANNTICEVQVNITSCTDPITGNPGKLNGSCVCIPDPPKTFQTGVLTDFSSSNPLLWGQQNGDGDLIKFSRNNISTNTFMVKNDGSVGIGTDSFDSDVAALVVSSTSKGILIPRLTTAQRDGVSGVDGLLLYNTDNKEFNFFNASTSAWESVGKTYSSGSGLSLNGTTFSVNFDEFTLTTTSGKLAVKYDPVFFTTNTYGLTFKYDEGFFTTSSLGLMLKDIGVVSSTYGSENTAVTLGIDNYGRVYFVATSTIMIGIDNITNSSSLARVDMENTFASPTIFSASTTFNATTTHNAGVRANLYCDASGTNCFDPSLGWVTTVLDVTTTPATTTGSFTFTTGTLRGYQAGNAICDHYYPGYHFCFSGEIISYIRTASNINKFAGLPQAWISEGPPGFTSDSNDCGGYTTADLEPLGAFWEFDSDGGGRGWLSTCGSAKNIACCK